MIDNQYELIPWYNNFQAAGIGRASRFKNCLTSGKHHFTYVAPSKGSNVII